ncbi:MAG: bifunctional NAD(P)H-hydrate repair enzyme Nnr [Litorilinea sp.]|nr:MAG: bifunctional NAD(P)H-hydrate repair enzyme Nnr [Litorilinea sp.]
MKVSTVAEMRAMDRAAIEEYGIPELLLMENAGLAACQVIERRMEIAGHTFAIFCGVGNNGGDGLVVARQLHARGGRLHVFILGDPDRYQGAAAVNYQAARRLGLEVVRLEQADGAVPALATCDAVVDALLGTGLTRDVTGLYAAVIAHINASGKPVFSIDIPSGVNGDTGQVMGVAVQATATITFGLPKVGNLLYPGYGLGGELWVSHISFPPALYDRAELPIAIHTPLSLPPRPPDGHKGTFGQALFIAGAANYYGAPYYAAASFLRAGGGYARLAAPAPVVPHIAAVGNEIVFLPQAATDAGSLAYGNKEELLELCGRMDFVVMGPGLSLHEETQQLVRELALAIDRPLLLDGDGITAVAHGLADEGYRAAFRQAPAPRIFTPHLGEMARLTGLSTAQLLADRIQRLQHACADLNAIIVLKGAHSLVGYPDGRVFINTSGNSGMATAGSGDVLTGTIAAMAGLGLPVDEAVRQGVFVHGLAGDLAAQAMGEDGMTARDVLAHLPQAVRLCRQGLPPELQHRYNVVRRV